MDADDGGGAMGGIHGDVGGGVNGGLESRMENADGDSEASTLQSMGYRTDDGGMGRKEGNAADSGRSVLESVGLITVALFVGSSLLYFLLTGILAMFGVYL